MCAPWVASALMNGGCWLPIMCPADRSSSSTIPTYVGRGSAAAVRPTLGANGIAASHVSVRVPAIPRTRYARSISLLGLRISCGTPAVYEWVWGLTGQKQACQHAFERKRLDCYIRSRSMDVCLIDHPL